MKQDIQKRVDFASPKILHNVRTPMGTTWLQFKQFLGKEQFWKNEEFQITGRAILQKSKRLELPASSVSPHYWRSNEHQWATIQAAVLEKTIFGKRRNSKSFAVQYTSLDDSREKLETGQPSFSQILRVLGSQKSSTQWKLYSK